MLPALLLRVHNNSNIAVCVPCTNTWANLAIAFPAPSTAGIPVIPAEQHGWLERLSSHCPSRRCWRTCGERLGVCNTSHWMNSPETRRSVFEMFLKRLYASIQLGNRSCTVKHCPCLKGHTTKSSSSVGASSTS